MKCKFGLICGIWLLFFFAAGCGRPNDLRSSQKESDPKVRTLPATTAKGTAMAPRDVVIVVGDSMRFSLGDLAASAEEVIRLKLVNQGVAPKEAMGHNWVLLRGGVDAGGFLNSALGAKVTDYIPKDRAGDIIAHTKLIGGGASDVVVFTVPTQPGDYVYLCSFPAHCQLGMKGVLTVR